VFRIAAGEMLGQDQPVILQLLELPLDKAQAALKGVMMELEDCALPLLAGMAGTADPKVAFKDADMAILVGARPRGPGMERKDLLLENAKIFIEQGRALDAVASRNVKILAWQSRQHERVHRDEIRAVIAEAQLHRDAAPRSQPRAVATRAKKRQACRLDRKARRLGQPLAHDVPRLPLRNRRRHIAQSVDQRRKLESHRLPAHRRKRGAAVIEARGLSSAASAANAAIDHMHDWILGTGNQWATMGVASDGSYGIPEDIMYGFPVTTANGEYTIVQGSQSMISRARR